MLQTDCIKISAACEKLGRGSQHWEGHEIIFSLGPPMT